ncbi:hypothetical protein SHA02_04980 [Salisediminibacterium halotolerans]|nr:hypothetical protein SHA02_04980 [Salisediminibacterium halotolerans]
MPFFYLKAVIVNFLLFKKSVTHCKLNRRSKLKREFRGITHLPQHLLGDEDEKNTYFNFSDRLWHVNFYFS